MSYNKLDPNPFDDDFLIEEEPQPTLQLLPIITPQQQQPTTKNTFEGGLFSINHYRQYFDLNTHEFFTNVYKLVNPFNKITTEELYEIGDLYGSIWITATLIFSLFFGNSLSVMIAEWVSGTPTPQENSFALLLFSINLLFGYLILVPVLTYLILRFYLQVLTETKMSKLISIYGYSYIWWIPLTLLSVFRGLYIYHSIITFILKWCLIGAGGVLSGLSIFIKLGPVLVQESGVKSGYALLLLLVVCHVVFTFVVQICFFGALV